MNDPRYSTLLKILDGIRNDTPQSDEFQRFHSKKNEDLIFSRGQSFIHLFLLVKFGVESFEDRHQLICDGPMDGGLDAYFIQPSEKIVYLIQSKFKSSDTGFNGESISVADLVKMELDRILAGETRDSNGVNYNPKIHEFQLNLNQATRKQIYQYKVIFLANLKNLNDFQIRKLTSKLDYQVFDFEKSYIELVKPLCSGTYYDPEKITIELDISEKSTPQLSQTIMTTYGNCDVTAVFVPTSEIARVMSKYKNAILRYNPRNYLGLSRNPVNKEIRESILSKSHNDFALLNNGITILADEQEFTVYTGTKNVGRLTLTNPQIINGGQTAYTLSTIYENDFQTNPRIFDGKEVLVRVVVLKEQEANPQFDRYKFIDAISTSTNQQTQVGPADRNSSNPIFISIQEEIYLNYGYLVELKRGEFFTGKEKGYVTREYIIDRVIMLRVFVGFSGRPTQARRHSEPQLFESSFFESVFSSDVTKDRKYLASKIFYAYKVHDFLVKLERKEGRKSLRYGYALRYGKYAVVYVSSLVILDEFRKNLSSRSLDEIEEYIYKNIPKILNKWKEFEEWIQSLKENRSYFNPTENLTDFDTYYKGSTLKTDLEKYFNHQ